MAQAYTIRDAAAAIHNGALVVFPTETVYGVGAAVYNEDAIAKIFEVKDRPRFDPLIVHIADLTQVTDVTGDFPEPARRLAQRFWPGPLTLVLPKAVPIPALVTAGLASVAVRMPSHPLALELIQATKTPLAAPSANRFGGVSPTTLSAARAELGGSVEVFLDGGSCAVGIESTIIGFTEGEPVLLRPGGLPLEELEAVIGHIRIPTGTEAIRQTSPGQSFRHYAPRMPLRLWAPSSPPPADAGRAILLTVLPLETRSFAHVRTLAPDGNLRVAAAQLFNALRRLDETDFKSGYVCLGPDTGLGRAINDRLQRAADNPLPSKAPDMPPTLRNQNSNN